MFHAEYFLTVDFVETYLCPFDAPLCNTSLTVMIYCDPILNLPLHCLKLHMLKASDMLFHLTPCVSTTFQHKVTPLLRMLTVINTVTINHYATTQLIVSTVCVTALQKTSTLHYVG